MGPLQDNAPTDAGPVADAPGRPMRMRYRMFISLLVPPAAGR